MKSKRNIYHVQTCGRRWVLVLAGTMIFLSHSSSLALAGKNEGSDQVQVKGEIEKKTLKKKLGPPIGSLEKFEKELHDIDDDEALRARLNQIEKNSLEHHKNILINSLPDVPGKPKYNPAAGMSKAAFEYLNKLLHGETHLTGQKNTIVIRENYIPQLVCGKLVSRSPSDKVQEEIFVRLKDVGKSLELKRLYLEKKDLSALKSYLDANPKVNKLIFNGSSKSQQTINELIEILKARPQVKIIECKNGDLGLLGVRTFQERISEISSLENIEVDSYVSLDTLSTYRKLFLDRENSTHETYPWEISRINYSRDASRNMFPLDVMHFSSASGSLQKIKVNNVSGLPSMLRGLQMGRHAKLKELEIGCTLELDTASRWCNFDDQGSKLSEYFQGPKLTQTQVLEKKVRDLDNQISSLELRREIGGIKTPTKQEVSLKKKVEKFWKLYEGARDEQHEYWRNQEAKMLDKIQALKVELAQHQKSRKNGAPKTERHLAVEQKLEKLEASFSQRPDDRATRIIELGNLLERHPTMETVTIDQRYIDQEALDYLKNSLWKRANYHDLPSLNLVIKGEKQIQSWHSGLSEAKRAEENIKRELQRLKENRVFDSEEEL